MNDLVLLMKIIKDIPKNLFTEKEILEMIIRNSDYGIMFEIEVDNVNKQIIYTINNDIVFYDHLKDTENLKYKHYIFYLKKDEIEILKYIVERFF